MLLYSNIIINFTGASVAGEKLLIDNSTSTPDISETFSAYTRFSKGIVSKGNFASICANNMYNALTADLSASGKYDISLSGTQIAIQARELNITFVDSSTLSNATVIVWNHLGQPEPIKVISNTISSFLTDKNNKVTVEVETNVLAVKAKIGDTGSWATNSANPFVFAGIRGSTTTVYLEEEPPFGFLVGNKASVVIVMPPPLNNGDVRLNQVKSPLGSTITVSLTDSTSLILEYSLDNEVWQSSNSFSGLLEGTYTVYVKDQYNAVAYRTFIVTPFAAPTEITHLFSYISKSMSIRFKRNIAWNNIDVYKTDDNTLSCEENVCIQNKYIQMFKPENVVMTQFLSNYMHISANVIKSDGTKDELTVLEKIKFIDIKNSIDARVYDIDGITAGLYFTSGNVYDYDTEAVIGTHNLSGDLPEWGDIGTYVMINDSWCLINDIIYNESLNADVLVIDYSHTGDDESTIAHSKYNKKNFNVYEFGIDFAQYTGQEIQVEILQNQVGYPDFNYLSEVIIVNNEWDKNVELIWFNTESTSVYYSTGITNIGNYEFLQFKTNRDSSLQINKTPSTSIVIEASNYEAKELVLDGLTTGIAQQVIEAALHKMLFVNKVAYVSNSVPEVEQIDNTNLHTVTLHLTKAQPPYSTSAL